MENNDNLKLKVASGILLIIIGFSFLLSDYINEKREKAFNSMNIELNELLAKETENIEEEPQEEQQEETTPEPEPVQEVQEETSQYVLINFHVSTPFYLQAVQTSKHPGARAVKPTSEARTPISSMAIEGHQTKSDNRFTTTAARV